MAHDNWRESPLTSAPTELKVPAAAAPSPDAECPRCRARLIDPAGLGWCKACGYCRSLAMEAPNQLLAAAPQPSRGTVLAGAAFNVPIWFWLLLLGVAGAAGLSLAAGRLLPPRDNLPRALWTSIQIGVGVLLVFSGQLVAVVSVAPEDERLSFKDAFVPMRLWGLVIARLPRLSGCLWISTFGAALVLCAILFVGGLQHWFTYLPGYQKDPPLNPPTRVWQ
jgi:hypothetical protein